MLSFIGDIYLDKPYDLLLDLEDYICNLEYPICELKTPVKNKIVLGQKKSYIEDTFQKKPIAVSLANNHMFDYGEEGFLETLDFLDKNNIPYFGAGNDKNNFNNPFIYKEHRVKTFFFAYCCKSTNPNLDVVKNQVAFIDYQKILKDISPYKRKGKIVVLLHWGDEEIKYPKANDIKLAHELIDNGVDLIIGHHAHVIQSYEFYHGKHIYYGIGNFVFPDLNVAYQDNLGNWLKYKKKQKKSNRESLIVDLNLDDFTVSERYSLLKNGTVYPKPGVLQRKLLNKTDYEKYFLKKIRKQKIMNFLKEPHKLNLSKLRRF